MDEHPSSTSTMSSSSSSSNNKVTFDQSVEFRQRSSLIQKAADTTPPKQAAWKKIFSLNRRPTSRRSKLNKNKNNDDNTKLTNDDWMTTSYPEDERISSNNNVDWFEKGRKAGVAAQQMNVNVITTNLNTNNNGTGILRRSFTSATNHHTHAATTVNTATNVTTSMNRITNRSYGNSKDMVVVPAMQHNRPHEKNSSSSSVQVNVNLKQLKAMRRNSNSSYEDCVCVIYTEDSASGRGLLHSLAKRKGCRTVVAMAQEIMDDADDNHAEFMISELLKEFDNNRIHVCAVRDYSDVDMVSGIIEGCSRIFFLTKHWEKFSTEAEETIALNLMKACYTAKVPEVILCTFEDVDADASSTGVVVDETNAQSQIMPQIDWSVCPSFEGMSGVKYYARTVGIRITHMITVVRGKSKRMLNLIARDDGSLQISAEPIIPPSSGQPSPENNIDDNSSINRMGALKQHGGCSQSGPIEAV